LFCFLGRLKENGCCTGIISHSGQIGNSSEIMRVILCFFIGIPGKHFFVIIITITIIINYIYIAQDRKEAANAQTD